MQLQSALPIVRALADGVNPQTGEAYGDDSPYAEPRVLRAIFAALQLMEQEVEREKRRERLPANFGKPWTSEEDALLGQEFEGGYALNEIARKHARTLSSVRLRLEKLGKIEPQQGAKP